MEKPKLKQAKKAALMPDENGQYGVYGGSYVPPELQKILDEITESYNHVKNNREFMEQLRVLNQDYTGRPSPIYYCASLSQVCGGAQIFLKREDLNHTGAHKINHCLGEALLAKYMGKNKLIAETGAGQHGVALATAAALVSLDCDIYMGEIDVQKQLSNVQKMKILGARVINVVTGTKTLKDAVDAAFEAYLSDPQTQFYAIGSVVGPHPFPMMVRDFQRIIGAEAREQFMQKRGTLPDALIACVGGGSNAIGLFDAFLKDKGVQKIGVEPAGLGLQTSQHAATLTLGKPGIIHGFKCYLLQDYNGNPLKVYSVASGLDYPGVGPQHSFLKDIDSVSYVTVTDDEAIEAFYTLSRTEGIIPALESAHAIAYAMKLARTLKKEQTILVNLSGRGDKDIDFVTANYGKIFSMD